MYHAWLRQRWLRGHQRASLRNGMLGVDVVDLVASKSRSFPGAMPATSSVAGAGYGLPACEVAGPIFGSPTTLDDQQRISLFRPPTVQRSSQAAHDGSSRAMWGSWCRANGSIIPASAWGDP